MKNLFMSLWLSNANRALGVGRGMVTAEMRRQQSAAAKEAMRAIRRAAQRNRISGRKRSERGSAESRCEFPGRAALSDAMKKAHRPIAMALRSKTTTI